MKRKRGIRITERPHKRRRRDCALPYDLQRFLLRFLPCMTIITMAGLLFSPAVEFHEFLKTTTIIVASQMCNDLVDLNHEYFVNGVPVLRYLDPHFRTGKIPTRCVDGSGVSFLDLFVLLIGPVNGFYLFLRHTTPYSHDQILEMTLYDGIIELYRTERTMHVFFLACGTGLNYIACEMFSSWNKSEFVDSFVKFQTWNFTKNCLVVAHFRQLFHMLGCTWVVRRKHLDLPVNFNLISIIILHGNLYLFEELYHLYSSFSAQDGSPMRQSMIICATTLRQLLVSCDWIPPRFTDVAHAEVYFVVPFRRCGVDMLSSMLFLTCPRLTGNYALLYSLMGSPHAYRVAEERLRPGFMDRFLDKFSKLASHERVVSLLKWQEDAFTRDRAWQTYEFENDLPTTREKHRKIYALLVETLDKKEEPACGS